MPLQANYWQKCCLKLVTDHPLHIIEDWESPFLSKLLLQSPTEANSVNKK